MLLLAAGAALGYGRINKLGFYQRYFQVIAEIEDRNSTDFFAKDLVSWSANADADLSSHAGSSSALASSESYLAWPQVPATILHAIPAIKRAGSLIWGLYPTRAP